MSSEMEGNRETQSGKCKCEQDDGLRVYSRIYRPARKSSEYKLMQAADDDILPVYPPP